MVLQWSGSHHPLAPDTGNQEQGADLDCQPLDLPEMRLSNRGCAG